MFFKCSPFGHLQQNHAMRAPVDGGNGLTVTNGNKHLTVDIHCHIHVPSADEMLRNVSPDYTGRSMVDTNPLTTEINKKQQELLREFSLTTKGMNTSPEAEGFVKKLKDFWDNLKG